MKSEILKNSLELNNRSIKDIMMSGDIQLITHNLNSDNNLGIVLAIGAVVKNHINTSDISQKLHELKHNNGQEFCMSISDLAYAALDLLDIEKYSGNDKQILELIKNNFNFIN